MPRALGVIASISLAWLLPGCGGESSTLAVPANLGNTVALGSPTSVPSALTLYWHPLHLKLIYKPGEGGAKFAKLWFSHDVRIYLDKGCKGTGVKIGIQGKGQKGRLFWNEYKLRATKPGPFSCRISALDLLFDSIEADLFIKVSK